MTTNEGSERGRLRVLALKALKECEKAGVGSAKRLGAVVERDRKTIARFCAKAKKLEEAAKLAAAFEWGADNAYLLAETAVNVREGLKNLKAVALTRDGLPFYYETFRAYTASLDRAEPADAAAVFIAASETAEPAPTFADHEGFGTLFLAAVLRETARLCAELLARPYALSPEEAGRSMAFLVTMLRRLPSFPFDEAYGESKAEKALLRDPAGFYPLCTAGTKRAYRLRAAEAAGKKGISEAAYLEMLREKAAASTGRERHIGAYLFGENALRGAKGYAAATGILTALPLAASAVVSPWLLVSLPLYYDAAKQLADRVLSRLCKPEPPLSLKLSRVPDGDGVLVTVTALLTGDDDALFERLEHIYHANAGDNVWFAILGDYADAPKAETAGDATILSHARDRMELLRRRYGDVFFLFVRPRVFSPGEGRFMGYERKRGAVCALVEYLCGGENAFLPGDMIMPQSTAAGVRYVVTLDADTDLPLDGAKELCGAMLHPLNRPVIDEEACRVVKGCALMQPAVATTLASARKTRFAGLLGAPAGSEPYAFARFDRYEALYAETVFCGKGIFDKEAFHTLLCAKERAFAPDTVLSHDILEGARLRCRKISTVELADSFPKNEISYLKRHHRWVRGDVQNLMILWQSRGKNAGFSLASRHFIKENVRREAVPVCAFALLLIAAFLKRKAAWIALFAAVLPFILPVLSDVLVAPRFFGRHLGSRRFFTSGVYSGFWQGVFRAALSLAMLPPTAFTTADAAVRAAYRMLVSGKKRLEWVTAASADKHAGEGLLAHVRTGLSGAFAGAFLLIFSPWGSVYGVLRLIGLMWFGFPVAADVLSRAPKKKGKATARQKAVMKRYAADVWKFFEHTAGADDHFLPIDNLRLFPTAVYAHRTSPTNIGLYLIATLAARDYGLIDTALLCARVERTLDTVERMEKWRGHLYNWYDTTTLAVLSPAYVSGVDTGNLLACLAALAEGLREYAHENAKVLTLADRAAALFEEPDLHALYDGRRKLFAIGVSFADGKAVRGENVYDTLMSEARILSYIAVAKRVADKAHWATLARPVIGGRERMGLASWTGTAFEYFMPALFLPFPEGSASYEALHYALEAQKARSVRFHGKTLWGISESGCFAFDADHSYRYKAFGVPALALKRGQEKELVLAPYAAALALCVDVTAPLEALKAYKACGVYGRYGFYEAVDFTPERARGGALVKSYMAHHMGMTLAAFANACFDDVFVRRFLRFSSMSAAERLLEEKIPVDAPVMRRGRRPVRAERPARPETHGETTVKTARAAFLGDGRVCFAARKDVVALFCGGKAVWDFDEFGLSNGKGVRALYRACDETAEGVGEGARLVTGDGAMTYTVKRRNFTAETAFSVLAGESAAAVRLCVRGGAEEAVAAFGFEPVLAEMRAYRAHPAFQTLFLTAKRVGDAAVFTKRARDEAEEPLYMAVGVCAGELCGICVRSEGLFAGKPDAEAVDTMLEGTLDERDGACITPYCLVRVKLARKSRKTQEAAVYLAFGASEEEALTTLAAARRKPFEAVRQRLSSQSALWRRAMGADGEKAGAILEETVGKLCDPPRVRGLPDGKVGQKYLWEVGISGDLPVTYALAPSVRFARAAAPLVRAYRYLRLCGAASDLVFIVQETDGYRRLVDKALRETLDETGAGELINARGGGVFIVDGTAHPDTARTVVWCGAEISGEAERTEEGNAKRRIIRTVGEAGNGEPEQSYLTSGCGWFDAPGVYTVDKRQKPPRPQSMVLTGGLVSSVVTHDTLGYTFCRNASLGRLTPFVNDAVFGGTGENVFLETGKGDYDLAACAAFVTYRPGVAVWRGNADGNRYEMTVCLPPREGVKVIDVTLEKPGSVCFRVFPVLGASAEENRRCVTAVEDDRVRIENPYTGEVRLKAFVWGENAVYGVGGGFVTARAGEGTHARFALGVSFTEAMFARQKRVLAAALSQMTGECETFSTQYLPCLSIETEKTGIPRALAAVTGTFLPYQAVYCRMIARSGFYQSGGAYGYRDQVQDALALLYADPARARVHLLRALAHRFEEGDVPHWWHTIVRSAGIKGPVGRGVRSTCSDDYLWPVYLAATYIRYTGDAGILAVKLPYLTGESLAEGEKAKYIEVYRSQKRDTVLAHLTTAVERVYRYTGERGLPLLRAGDWCDGLDRAGEKDRGESVWLGMFAVLVTDMFLRTCGGWLDEKRRETLKHRRDALAATLAACAFDEESGLYIRAWDDGGAPLGDGKGEGGTDLLPNAFAVLAGIGDGVRARAALRKAFGLLYDEKGRYLRLLTPPYDLRRGVGYIASYVPGVRENGGQYTHGAVWGCIAMIRAGLVRPLDGEMIRRGVQALMWLLPSVRGLDAEICGLYGLEAYATAADVYDGENCRGRGGWSWYTGSAAWLFAALVREVFGLSFENTGIPDAARLVIGKAARYAPFCLADALTLRFREPVTGTSLAVRYVSSAKGVTLDGRDCDGCVKLDGLPHGIVIGRA